MMTRAEDKGKSNHGRICKRFKIARALTPTRFEVVEAIVMMCVRIPMDQMGAEMFPWQLLPQRLLPATGQLSMPMQSLEPCEAM
jgi:hypothetical protein